MNNLTVNSVMDEEYDEFFGFTESEVQAMLGAYGVQDKEEELKAWYDGYLFGNKEIYNPWSVINYISKGCLPQAYWVNTGKNEILEDVLQTANEETTEKLYALLQGEQVVARIDQNVVYRSLAEDPANIYSLLLVAGYLKTPKKELQGDGAWLCQVSIPNREISAVYKNEILSHLMQIGAIERTTANKIAESLYALDLKKLQKGIAEYMNKSISFYDSGAEGFYHGLVLGLIAMMDNQYKIKSKRESGDGRYDICLFPRDKKYPGIIMKLKSDKDLSDKKLDDLSAEALDQIDDKRYDAEMQEEGIKNILKLGIAFSGKKVKIIRATETYQQAGAYYVRIQAMAKKHHITLRQEFDDHDTLDTKYIVVTDDEFPVATARMYPLDGAAVMIGRAVVESRDNKTEFYLQMGYGITGDTIDGDTFHCIRMEKAI